ncbi:MAG: hypothetical protein RBS33_13050, partial [Lentimicrobium sp.]|nr:hypothetical protein [Lentimicrobium sp.]
TRFVVSDLLERNASEAEKVNGLDLADYLTRFDYRLFRKEPAPTEPITPQQPETPPQATGEPEIWHIIERQFTDRLNSDVWLNPGKTSDEIYYDLTVLSADCLINYGIDVTPDQYYKALKWREAQIN